MTSKVNYSVIKNSSVSFIIAAIHLIISSGRLHEYQVIFYSSLLKAPVRVMVPICESVDYLFLKYFWHFIGM